MARKDKLPKRLLPRWVHKMLRKRTRLCKLRAAHGANCWRCGHPMRFDGRPNCGKAATIEHVIPRSKGATWALENLRLCDVGCNRHLADHLPEQKERMRINLPRQAEGGSRDPPRISAGRAGRGQWRDPKRVMR